MPKNGPPPNADELAQRLRASQEKIAATLAGEGATPQVMAGFAEAYRAWIESLKPETLARLQNDYMQEQLRLWSEAVAPQPDPSEPVADKRFAAPEWNALPVFRYLRDS